MVRIFPLVFAAALVLGGCDTAKVRSACELLTLDEVGTSLGVAVARASPSVGSDWRQCDWSAPGAGSVALYVRVGDYLDEYVAETKGTAVPVVGIGIRAFWHPIRAVFATDGRATVRVQDYSAEGPDARPGLEHLARLALARAASD
jgi:hypothetical protein